MPLALYIAAITGLALATAYTRNFQRTLVTLQERLGAVASSGLTPRAQSARTALVAGGWPLLLLAGLAVVAWWKAVALTVGGFLILVPALGSLTPRAMAAHYLDAIQGDLAVRIRRGGHAVDDLDQLQRAVEAFRGSAAPPP